MTHLKKSLAMLLALIMMFSTMSVAANAWTVNDDPNDITFTVKFYREDPKNPGNWIETAKAAPDEDIKARVFIKTGFYTYGGESCFIFERDFFNLPGFENDVTRPITVNDQYAGPDDDAYGAGGYKLVANANWKSQDNYDTWDYDIDYIVNEIENDSKFFEKYDLVPNTIKFGSGVDNSKLSDSDWMYEFDLKVNDNTATNTVDNEGDAEVPPYNYSKSCEAEGEMIINITKGEKGAFREKNMGMWLWEPELSTNSAVITTTSEIIFDMGLVDANGEWEEDTYTTEKGIISKEVDFTAVVNPVHPEGKEFAYWSAQKPGTGATQTEAVAFKYDYDVQTLYAVWTDAPQPTEVEYTLNEYYMNADGTYPTEVQGTTQYAAPNSTVSAEEPSDTRFFLDEEKSSKNVVIDVDGSSVVNAYYERNKYNLVYHYEDITGAAKTETYPTYFGAPLHSFDAVPGGEPSKPDYNFVGWTTVEGGTEAETLPTEMPTEELHLYAVYEYDNTYDVTFTFKAMEGNFPDGDNVKIYYYNFYDEVIIPENPKATGKNFAEWDGDIPKLADMDRTFEAIYEDVLYTVTFKADKDEDGVYETTVSEQTFAYGEKIYTEFAPINYPTDVWALENGTKVVIDDSENAYTVTDDVTLYTTGDDKYPARFYLTQEDLDNGAEPYEEIFVTFDESIPNPGAPAKEDIAGYNFIQWDPDVESGLIMDSTDGMNFVAVLEVKDIKVTFNPNEGKCEEDEMTDKYGESIKLPEVSREGYEFLGWYDGNTKVGMPGDEYKLPADDVTLTAQWEKNIVYSIITLDANGGKFSNGAPVYPVKAEVGVPFNAVPTNPTRDGYEFDGWVDENGKETSIPKYFPPEDITIKAKWKEIFDVTYYNEDGTEFKKYIDAGLEGADVPVPTDEPQKDGHYFAGWVDKNGNAVTKIPNGNLELYPKFEENPTFTITYKDGDKVVNTAFYEEGEEIADYKLDDKDGYKFAGWDPQLPETMPAEPLEVKAVWEANKHNIKLDAGEGKFKDGESVFDETFEYGEDISGKLPEDPAREGYEFKGWQDSTGAIVDLPDVMPDNGFDLTAKWEVNQYTITFDTDGGDAIDAKTYDYGAAIGELPVPVKAGHVFAGWTWTNEKGETVDACTTMPAYNVTVKASWDVAKHNVDYYLAENGELYKSLSFEEGAPIVHPDDPTVEGLTFVEWVDENGNALPENMVMGTDNIKVYAKFDVNTYKVTYMVDGEVYAEYDVLYQAEVPVPDDPEDSAVRMFAGWSPAPEAVMPARNLTYTATWADPEPDKFTATFLRPDGKTFAKSVLAEGDAIPVPAEGPKKFGYVFVGWEPEVPATMPAEDLVFEPQYEIDKTFVTIVVGGTVVAGGVIAASIANAAIITGISIVGGVIVLVGVAELVKNTHTVTYIVDGEVYKTYKVVKGTKIPVPADPAKDGFVFEGWNPEVPEKMGNEDLVFEATWTEKSADDSEIDVDIPETGSVAGGLAAFAAISGAAAAAYAITRKKKED